MVQLSTQGSRALPSSGKVPSQVVTSPKNPEEASLLPESQLTCSGIEENRKARLTEVRCLPHRAPLPLLRSVLRGRRLRDTICLDCIFRRDSGGCQEMQRLL